LDVRLVAALLLASTPARADDDVHSRDKVLAADAICDGLALSAAIPKLPDDLVTLMFWGGIIGQVVISPTIHAIDQDYGRAGASLGLRVAGPVLGAITGGVICEKLSKKSGGGEFFHCLGGAFIGGIIGILAAQATDWLVISRPERLEITPSTGFVFRF
jgi:hypothetical protein